MVDNEGFIAEIDKIYDEWKRSVDVRYERGDEVSDEEHKWLNKIGYEVEEYRKSVQTGKYWKK
jgi:hypothetical protein